MRSLAIAVLFALLSPFAAKATTTCPVERAHYGLRGRPDVTAGFTALPKGAGTISNVGFHVDFAREGDHFWWFFDRGSARYLTMISTTDFTKPGWRHVMDTDDGPLHGGPVWFADDRYNLNYDVPALGGAAPRHIFVADLEEAMWYQANRRRGVPTAFFDLTGCR